MDNSIPTLHGKNALPEVQISVPWRASRGVLLSNNSLMYLSFLIISVAAN